MTDRELAAQADYHLRRTTISYPEWVKRKNAGRYSPADGSGTEWGKAFAALEQIGVVVEPPPPPPPPTGTLHLKWDRYDRDVQHKYGALDRITDVTLSVMPPGVTSVMRVEVKGVADSSTGGDGTYMVNRSDGQGETWIKEGAETWESFWMLVPNGTDSRFPGKWVPSVFSAGWNAFYEYHEPGIAPVSSTVSCYETSPPRWHINVVGGPPSAPRGIWCHGELMRFNVWQQHLVHWKWSRGNSGYVEWWIDGRLQVGRTTPNDGYGNPNIWPGPQMCDNYPNAWDVNGTTRGGYVELGHYRGPERSDVDTTYVAKFRVASTRELAVA